jgi:hypothetical protein
VVRGVAITVWRLVGALFLLVMGGIHIFLVFDGVGGTLGALFVVNAVGALALALGLAVLKGRRLLAASALSVLFMAGTLLALVLALTVGLFGITETLNFTLVRPTLVVESVGTVVLLVTTALLYRAARSASGR